jgi:hypothetical protein
MNVNKPNLFMRKFCCYVFNLHKNDILYLHIKNSLIIYVVIEQCTDFVI